jgi:hypothetical protein
VAVADALDYLHQAGRWHHGVKPTNVLVGDQESGRRRILLSDFVIGCRLAGRILAAETLAHHRISSKVTPTSGWTSTP